MLKTFSDDAIARCVVMMILLDFAVAFPNCGGGEKPTIHFNFNIERDTFWSIIRNNTFL